MRVLSENPSLVAGWRVQATPLILQHLTDQNGVRFEFSGPARTDGTTVWLGDIAPEHPDFDTIALGHGVHEMMHVLHTDFASFTKARLSVFFQSLFNILEDIRVDSLGMQTYTGYGPWRAQLAELLESQGALIVSRPVTQMTPVTLFCAWFFTVLGCDIGLGWAQRHRTRLDNAIKERLPLPFLETVLSIGRKIHQARTTRDTLAIVRELQTVWTQTSETPENALGEDSKSTSDQAQAAVQRQLLARLANASHDDLPPAESQVLRQLSAGGAAASGTPDTDPRQLRVMDWPETPLDEQMRNDVRIYQQAFTKVHAQFELTQAQFLELLKSRIDDDEQAAYSGSDLCPDFISRLPSRSLQLFSQPAYRDQTNADICILLDRSGSMGVHTMSKAKAAVAALCGALFSQPQIRFTLGLFPGVAQAHVAVLTRPRESFSAFLERFKCVGAYGSTPIVQAMDWGRQELGKARGARRLLLVITDGVYPQTHIHACEKILADERIELAVLGIDTDIEGLATNSILVESADEIAPALVHLFERTALYRILTADNSV